MPKPFSIRAAGEDSAELLIYGDIGDSWYGESVSARDVIDKLQSLDATQIIVRINSYGGSVSDGLAIYNALRQHAASILVRVEGVAVSCASLIAMAGDSVEIAENAVMMIHAPWGGVYGNSVDLRAYADVLDVFAKGMATSYARKTGGSYDDMLSLLTDGVDHWYTANEAIEMGFADSITKDSGAAEPTVEAAFNHSRFFASCARYRAGGTAKFQTLAAPVAAINQLVPKEAVMPKATNLATEPSGADPVMTNQQRAAVLQEDQQRRNDIAAAFQPFAGRAGVSDMLASCQNDPGVSVDSANKRLLALLGEGAEPVASGGRFEVVSSEQDKHIEACTNALLSRMGVVAHDRGNPYRGLRMNELARMSLERAGVAVRGMAPEEYAPLALSFVPPRGAQTTSDFPVILENVMHKLVLLGFQAQPLTWSKFCKIGDVTDFRAWNRLVPGLIGNLDDVNEAGEYLDKVIPDAQKNSVQAKRRGNIISITPEVIVNDDTGYITDMARALGGAGGRAIERAVYALLESNPVLSDGLALFHASHGNLAATGTAISVDALDAGGSAMAVQRAPGSDAEYLDISPNVLLVNRAQKGNATVLVGAEYDPDTTNKLQKPNKVRGIVSDIVATPRIAPLPWYLFADPAIAPVIEVIFLNGQREPRIVAQEAFRTGGLEWRVELPFGVGAIDYRGAYRNAGV